MQVQSTDVDYLDHVQTYRSFTRGVMFVVASVLIILALMAYFLL